MKFFTVFHLIGVWSLTSWTMCCADRKDWIDPTDMINYDMSTGKMNNKASDVIEPVDIELIQKRSDGDQGHPVGPMPVEEPSSSDTAQNCDSCEIARTKLLKSLSTCEDSLDSIPASEMVYFRQFVRGFLQDLPPPNKPRDDEQALYQADFSLAFVDYAVLHKFAVSDSGSVQDAHAVLAHMIHSIRQMDPLEDSGQGRLATVMALVSEYFLVVLQVMTMISCAVIAVHVHHRSNLSVFNVCFRLLGLLFLVSVPWNWWHIYQVKLAERQSRLMKELPAECSRQELGLMQTLLSAFTVQGDACAKYHRDLLVDPILEVSPLKALAVTASTFVMEPAEHIGTALGKLIKSTLQELPLQIWPFALGLIVLLLFLLLTMVFGYRIRMFYLFGLEPNPQAAPNNQILGNQENIAAQLTALLEAARATQQAIECVAATPAPIPPSYPAVESARVEKVPTPGTLATQGHGVDVRPIKDTMKVTTTSKNLATSSGIPGSAGDAGVAAAKKADASSASSSSSSSLKGDITLHPTGGVVEDLGRVDSPSSRPIASGEGLRTVANPADTSRPPADVQSGSSIDPTPLLLQNPDVLSDPSPDVAADQAAGVLDVGALSWEIKTGGGDTGTSSVRPRVSPVDSSDSDLEIIEEEMTHEVY